jgi:pyoverdine/dityrosine biosynthesis protein Dit1
MNTAAQSFEQEYANCAVGSRLGFERERRYDSEYGIFHSAGRRRCEPVDPGPRKLPDKNWVRSALLSMVVGTGSRRGLARATPRVDRAEDGPRVDIETFPLARYIEACEEEYVFGGRVDNVIGPASEPTVQRFINLVRDPFIGSVSNRQNVDATTLTEVFAHAEAIEAPIQLLLPAMPFKDQCVFRTACPADHIDLGEFAFLVRLHCLALAVNQIHRYDGECVVISDGLVYAEMFGVSRLEAARYVDHLRDARDRLNIAKSVHIIDLESLLQRDDEFRSRAGLVTSRRIRTSIRKSITSLNDSDADVRKAFGRLVAGMRWNINTRSILGEGGLTLPDLWRWLCGAPGKDWRGEPAMEHLEARASGAAFEYASFNLALAYSRLLQRHFPTAVRLTSHAKKGQVMAPRLGSVFPWNGVAITTAIEEDTVKASSIQSSELFTALGKKLIPVYERNGRFPICYTKEGSI